MRKVIKNSHYINTLKKFVKGNCKYKYNDIQRTLILFVDNEQIPLYMSPNLYQKLIFLKSRSALTKGD